MQHNSRNRPEVRLMTANIRGCGCSASHCLSRPYAATRWSKHLRDATVRWPGWGRRKKKNGNRSKFYIFVLFKSARQTHFFFQAAVGVNQPVREMCQEMTHCCRVALLLRLMSLYCFTGVPLISFSRPAAPSSGQEKELHCSVVSKFAFKDDSLV